MYPVQTLRFYAAASEYPVEKSGHTTIYFKGYHFGHSWIVPEGYERTGQWTFNRGSICMENDWRPEEYWHPTLAKLIEHLEATFPDVEPKHAL